MTLINVREAAAKLRVVSVFQPGNESGVVTQPSRYVAGARYDRFVRHVTVGTNSLKWLAQTGPAKVCIPYLIPTEASDPHDDNWTVYKMIPSDCYTFHVGDMEFHGEQEGFWHPRAMGHEYENLGDFKHEVEDRQYLKGALLYAHDCAVWKWQDYRVFDHSTIAVDHTNGGGRRTDPQAGLFRESVWWDYIAQIRRDWPWQDVPVWYGGPDK